MIRVKCSACEEKYPAGADHKCIADGLEPGAVIPVVKTDFLPAELSDVSAAELIKAWRFYKAHVERSREGMRRMRAKKK